MFVMSAATPTPYPHRHEASSADALLAAARKLDQDALAAIHDHFYPQIYRYIRYRLDDDELSEDLASDVFLRLVDALRRRQGPDTNLAGWLFSTASHLVMDAIRRKYRRPQIALEGLELPDPTTPEDAAERSLLSRELLAALAALKPHEQHVLTLRFAEERPLEEVAQIMKKSIGAVKVLQFRAVAALRKVIEGRQAL